MTVVLKEEVTMSAKENKAIVRRFYEEYYNKRNEAVLDELISPDYVYWTSAPGGWRALPTRGPQCIREFTVTWRNAFPDFVYSIESMIAEGDRVVTVNSFRGTHAGDFPRGPGGQSIKATGRLITVVEIVMSRVSAGQVVEEWQSFNTAALWRALGAV
jgi:predicted ester cyclase